MDEINKGGLFMKTVVDKANTRGYANHGWLKTASKDLRRVNRYLNS